MAEALLAPPAKADAVAALGEALGVPVPETLAAFLARSNGGAFMEAAHAFTAHFPDGQVQPVVQWLYNAGEIARQTALWHAPSPWTDGPALPRHVIVVGSAADDFDQGIVIIDARKEATLPGMVCYRRLGFDPALSDLGDFAAHGFVAPDFGAFLRQIGAAPSLGAEPALPG
jgi:hypothetical protein